MQLSYVPSVSFLLLVAACFPGLAEDATAPEAMKSPELCVEMFRDPHFQRGFQVQDPKPGKVVVVGKLAGLEEGEPAWNLAQWSSKHDLVTATGEKLASGALRYANQGKSVVIGLPGTEDADLTLGVRAQAEYGDHARKKGEPWPHLLATQRFELHPALKDLEKLVLSISVRLRESTLGKTEDYDSRIHAAQFVFYVTAQNLNRQSPGYGDYLYFGVPLYDDRYPHGTPKPFAAPDAAGKFIYTPPASVYTSETTHSGQWVTITKDLLPLLLEGLNTAWARGFLPASHDLSDYRVGGMNLGWEVPGVLNVQMQLRDLSLKAFPKAGIRLSPGPASG